MTPITLALIAGAAIGGYLSGMAAELLNTRAAQAGYREAERRRRTQVAAHAQTLNQLAAAHAYNTPAYATSPMNTSSGS